MALWIDEAAKQVNAYSYIRGMYIIRSLHDYTCAQ